jgi:hypothetical protein
MGVETALAATGLATTLGSTAMSFIGAGKEKRKQREAERAAERAMAEVRKQLSVNYFDQVAIKKEPYELQREALLSQGAMAIQAGQESQRGSAPTAGKTQMAMNEAQAGIRTSMGERMDVIEQQAIEEDSRLRDLNAQLTMGQIEGAKMAAANAEEAAAAANQQGFQGVASTLQQGIAMIPLFANNGENDFNNQAAMPASMAPAKPSYNKIPTRPMPTPTQLGVNPNPYMGYYSDFMGTDSGKFGTNFSGVGGF